MSAAEIRTRAAEWLERREREDWNEADQAALDAWLAQSPANLVAYLRVHDIWERADRLTALRGSPPVERAGWFASAVFKRTVAALITVAVVSTATAFYLSRPREQVYATAIGEHRTIAMADGSQIELNTDSVLRVLNNGAQRQAWLDKGEAYFQIKHDAAHPFTVMAAGHRLTDLGTEFLVREGEGRLEVALMKGKVRLDAADAWMQPHSALLAPGDVAIATADAMSVARKSTLAIANELGWRRGVLVFKYATLAEAASEFNRYNREKLVVADNAAARLTIVGTFRDNDVAAFTGLAQEIFRVRVEKNGDEIVISR
ncbi:MAG TPA: FecR domain-containing protein [Rhizomicrobium sp.]